MPAATHDQEDASNTPAVRVYSLGAFRVLVGNQVVEDNAWRRRTARQLFKVLLTRPGRRMTRDEVVELFWPESDPDAASTNFRSTLHAMRRAIEPSDRPGTLGIVFSDRDTVWLRPDLELWVDADHFEHSIQDAWRSSDPLPILMEASELYGGQFLPDDLYEDWAIERRERLKQNWAELQIRLSHELERRGDPEAATRPLQHLLEVEPWHERAAQEAMQLFARIGRRPEALRVYQRLVRALDDELGVAPTRETRDIQTRLEAGELSGRPAAPIFRCAYPFPEPVELVGRAAEHKLLERVLLGGRTAGQAAVIGAPAGTGKSALVGTIVKQAQAQGVLCLAGGCYEGGGAVPLGPFHDALVDFLLAQPADEVLDDLGTSAHDLGQVVPELRYHLKSSEPPGSGQVSIDRMRAFGAIYTLIRTLAGRGPVLLCLEDLHAADEATLQLFHYLARQTRRLPLVLLATYRSDEVPGDQPLAQTLAAMLRERLLQQIRLTSLGRRETDRLLSTLLEGSPGEALVDSLFATTGGNPLFIEQLVLALQETGQIQEQGGVWYGSAELHGTPQIVREVIAQRLARLARSCREMLAMASVLGQSFEHKVLLAAVSPVDEPVLLRDLDLAIGAQMLQETPSGYAFRHGLLREAVYWDLSAPRRMLMHAQAGQLIERLRGDQADDYAAELAHHFGLAGESAQIQSKTLHYSMQAGKRAADLSSYGDSLLHFGRALEIIEHSEVQADTDTRLEALRGLGLAESITARYADSVASFRKVLALSKDPIQRGFARQIVAFSLNHAGAFDEVIEESQAGLAELVGVQGPRATRIRVTLQQLIAVVWYAQGRFRDVTRLGEQIVSEANLADSRARQLAQFTVAWGHMGQGQVIDAIEHYQLALKEAELDGDRAELALAYQNLGQEEYLGGRFAAAREHLTRALTLFHDSASELRAASTLHSLCRVWVAEGEHARARESILGHLDQEIAGRVRWAAEAHHILGTIQTLCGEWDAAAASFERALAGRKQAGHLPGTVEALVALGFVEQCLGRWGDASEGYTRAVAITDRMDPGPHRVLALRHRGRLRLLNGDRLLAAEDIGDALALAEAMPETIEYSPTLRAMSELRLEVGDLDRALELATESLQRARPLDQAVEAHVVLARVYLTRQECQLALSHAREAVALGGRLGSPRLLSLAHLVLAEAMSEQVDVNARDAFQTALRYADEAETAYERALTLNAYARFARVTESDAELAESMEDEAITIMQSLRGALNPHFQQPELAASTTYPAD
jgi:DNA-binding SARP family transcriptional activator